LREVAIICLSPLHWGRDGNRCAVHTHDDWANALWRVYLNSFCVVLLCILFGWNWKFIKLQTLFFSLLLCSFWEHVAGAMPLLMTVTDFLQIPTQ